ncbi:MAG: hypothetical protein HZA89_13305 [Verrucomicrobia bacterium]|nr:hypothetical protein [Verrucomicrobiota bacterium]
MVVPPPPAVTASMAEGLKTTFRGGKKPLDRRENPLARDARGTASRAEIRRETPRVAAPRQSNRPAERRGQPRSRVSKKQG